MSLDDLLKPLKWADEEILTKYSRITKWWENKEHSIYLLTAPIGSVSIIPLVVGLHGINPHLVHTIYPYASDATLNVFGLENMFFTSFFGKEKAIDDTIVYNPLIEAARKMVRIIRLPTFMAGGFFAIKGGYELVDYIHNGNSASINDLLTDLNCAIGFLGHATSMYLKDGDPKLLDKEPLWKRAYEKSKEFVSYGPAPQPVPIPIPPRN